MRLDCPKTVEIEVQAWKPTDIGLVSDHSALVSDQSWPRPAILTWKPNNEEKGWQFGFEANEDETHETDGNYVLDHWEEVDVEVQNCYEHEDCQYSAGQLHVRLRPILAQRWHTSEQTATLDLTLGQQQQQSTAKTHISQQKVQIP